MAKGQMRSSKEKKKPKAENSTKKKGGLPPHLQMGQGGGQSAQNLMGKKGS